MIYNACPGCDWLTDHTASTITPRCTEYERVWVRPAEIAAVRRVLDACVVKERPSPIARGTYVMRCLLCRDSWNSADPPHHSYINGGPCPLREVEPDA